VIAEAGPFLGGEGFGAAGEVEAGAGVPGVEVAENFGELFAAAGEGKFDEGGEAVGIVEGAEGVFAALEMNDGAADAGRGEETGAGDVADAFDVVGPAHADGEEAVGVAAGGGEEAFGDVALHHDGDGEGAGVGGGEVVEDAAADGVGEVGDDADVGGAELADPVGAGGILIAEFEFGVIAQVGPQMFHEAGVEFDGEHGGGAVEQALGHDTEAGADFDDGIGGTDFGGIEDEVAHMGVDEKVLAHALAGREPDVAKMGADFNGAGEIQARVHAAGSPVVARVSAVWRAARVLSGRARFCPAMAKAVPWSGEVRIIGRPRVMLTPSSKAQSLSGASPWS